MGLIPDELTKKVTIPVKVVNGKLVYYYGNRLPPLREGAIGEMRMPENAVTDPLWLNLLQEEHEEQILPEHTPVLVAMRFDEIPDDLYEKLYDYDCQSMRHQFMVGATAYSERNLLPVYSTTDWIGFGFVEIILQQSLRLLLRGTKRATLRPCNCVIPVMEDERSPGAGVARSLNHAYSLVSQVFEPKRISHTGNVFDKVRYFDEERDHWRLLGDLRDKCESEWEASMMARQPKVSKAKPPDTEPDGVLPFLG